MSRNSLLVGAKKGVNGGIRRALEALGIIDLGEVRGTLTFIGGSQVRAVDFGPQTIRGTCP